MDGRRPLLGHLAQRRIMEDDIGRYPGILRQFAATGAQRIEQRIADRIGIAAIAGIALLPLAPRRHQDAHFLLPAQDRPGIGAEHQPAMLGRLQRVPHQQRARHRPQQRRLVAIDDRIDGDFVMPALANLVGDGAAQHRLDMARAKALAGAIDRRQIFARGLGRVDAGRRGQAIVAIAAGRGRILAKMPQQDRPAAGRRFHQRPQRRDPRPLALLARGLQLHDALAGTGEILRPPEEMRDRRFAIAAGAARFLIIALDRLGQAGMGDEAHVGLVDPHAEGDGGDHHHILAGDEGGLVGGALGRVHAGMIGAHRPAVAPQRLGQLLGRGAGRRIDDTRPRIGGEQIGKLPGQPVARMDGIADIGPVEARNDKAILGNAELDEDILARMRIRRRRQRQPRDIGKLIEQRPQQPIVGAEIMPPFGHAMRLIDREQRDLRRAQQIAEPLAARPFRRDIEQVQFAIAQPVLRLAPVGIDAGQAGGADADSGRCTQLVMHQRDQRRDDDAAAIERNGGQLIAKRLARAGRHDRQGRLPRHDPADHLFLHPAERREAENIVEQRGNVARHGPALASQGHRCQ